MKNQPKISENPYFWNDRVLEGNTCGKVQNFYKNAIFVIFLNWCKVWILYHDPSRAETSVGNCAELCGSVKPLKICSNLLDYNFYLRF